MSKRIAVRLSDDIVEFIDSVVEHGDAGSRAAVVTRAVERERHREIAAREVAILAQTGGDPGLDGLVEYAACVPMDDID